MIDLVLLMQFIKYGLLCFGGGFMIIPLLFEQFVEIEKLFTLTEFGNLISIAPLTPGAVSMNTATYVGFLKNGITGALSATIGLALPTFIIALIALLFLKKFENSWVTHGILQGGRWAAVFMYGYALFLFLGMSVFMKPLPIQETVAYLFGSGKPIESISVNYLCLFVFIGSVILFFRTKLSMITVLLLAAFIGFGYSIAARADEIDDTRFYQDMCQQGFSTTWTNACECYESFSGVFCDEAGETRCQTTSDCPENTYCNAGYCYRLVHYSPIQTEKGELILSRSLMSYEEAQAFCERLSARLVTRSDFDCDGYGVGCLNMSVLRPVQETTHLRGFIWLDSLDEKKAYYTDLNDGTIYSADKQNRKYTQALCIQKVKK